MTPRSVELVPAMGTDWPWWQSAVQMAWRCCRDRASERVGQRRLDDSWTPTPRMATRSPAPQFHSIATARSFTLRTMQRWGAVDCGDDVASVVSELLTNALRHALPRAVWPGQSVAADAAVNEPAANEPAVCAPAADGTRTATRSTEITAAGPIRLGLLLPGPYVVCAVADPSAAAPVPRQPDWLEETGRGLQVVASLSHRWGYCMAPGELGKVVWAAFPTAARPF
jgi:hypothetical protein